MDGGRNYNRRGGGNARGRGGYHHQPSEQQSGINRPQAPAIRPPTQQTWINRFPGLGAAPREVGNRPPQPGETPFQQPPRVNVGPSGGGRVGAWTGRPWGQSPAPSTSNVQLQPRPPSPSPTSELDLELLRISSPKPLSPSSESNENLCQPIKRPDKGGTLAVRPIDLFVNHYPVKFDPSKYMIHYNVEIKPVDSRDSKFVKKPLRKSEMRLIRDKWFSDNPDQFPLMSTAYDGEKNIFSSVHLPTGQFRVEISDGEDVKRGAYMLTIKFVNELKLSNLEEYFKGNRPYIPRDILQGMDLVMKENPFRQQICVGKSFFSSKHGKSHDLGNGIAALRGSLQSLKPTSQGLILCLDHVTLAFHKPIPVIDYLIEHIPQVKSVNDIKPNARFVNSALRGLKVSVIHRRSKQKYTISGLANENTCDSYFDLIDPEGNNPPQRISLVAYFCDKWKKDIKYLSIPCLELGKSNKSNKVPMEFCVLIEGQRFPKEQLNVERANVLKKLSTPPPWERKDTINQMLRREDGPCGEVSRSFDFRVVDTMTRVVGRVLAPPGLKLGGSEIVKVDAKKCQWNLVGRRILVDPKSVQRWALIDFTDGDRYELQKDAFIRGLIGRCRKLGMYMKEPLLLRSTNMQDFSRSNRLEVLIKSVVDEAKKKSDGNLQIIICVMTRRDPGYNLLKWICETRIGVLTQCCLSVPASKAQDQYLANLCLKINVKLGGNNFELVGRIPHFGPEDHVMFIGADVNHPSPMNTSCPSIAAIVGSVNWPAANRYAARVRPQQHRREEISNFGSMCRDLVDTYAHLNKVRPNKIVLFRDGVSEGQFDMVLAKELIDLKNAIYNSNYQPKITLVVAQKRHQTRLFVENKIDGGESGNVPPGTVVDTKIIHPFHFDFYICSHYGGLGTSKPTHYFVLWDENSFSSDELQKLINDMCYTFGRCTKPVSLVPPVYYADIVAFRGRMFQEAAMESQAHGGTSSGTVVLDHSFYRLHADLENSMFFV